MKLHQDKWENPKMIKYILILSIFGTFLLASDSQPTDKLTLAIVINDDDSDKVYAGRKRGKGNRSRRRGGNGLQ